MQQADGLGVGSFHYGTASYMCEYGNTLDVETRNQNIAAWARTTTAAGLP